MTVAADATRPPHRRKLTRKAALTRYRRGRATLDWLYGMRLDGPPVPPEPPSEGCRFESFAE